MNSVVNPEDEPAMTGSPSRAYGLLQRMFSLLTDEPMARHTTFKVGGPADLFFAPATKGELIGVIKCSRELGIAITLVGSGTNLLVRDRGIRGLVVTTKRMNKNLALTMTTDQEGTITASSGVILGAAARFAMERGMAGFEFCAGIPGTVGGAVMMNAGTNLGTIADSLVSLEVLSGDGEISTIDRSQLSFAHREIMFDSPGSCTFVLGARFRVFAGDKQQIRDQWHSLLELRHANQPGAVASAGCFFKNPDGGMPAGLLIDRAGLKGRKFGNAMVSKIHGNFIVNLGGATAMEILTLKRMVQDEVREKFNVDLKPEVKIEGE
ncbi:MAG: UDP-N-acetylmuramate dehydrogenase [Desulfobacterium sp.]|nr:UDP-N-acetylmuramate dehydrogenase [Desulfobacterium sp.]